MRESTFAPFQSVFIAVFLGTAVIIAALIIHNRRPARERLQPTAELIRATGRCAECHRQETAAIVDQYERSRHAAVGASCLDCHRPIEGQPALDHRGFTIAEALTAKNCQECHTTQYQQFARSRHAAPAWAAVYGSADFTREQVEFAERFHPGAVERPPNALAHLEGPAAIESGCLGCHKIGEPQDDGSIGRCTECHGRHSTSVALAREPETCGQCHMGPDHSQIEIYHESKHGVLFKSLRTSMNLDADPSILTTSDMSVPTCATCHMSGLNGMKFTHDVTERLSYWLFAPISERRPTYARGQAEMKEVCTNCHARPQIDAFYEGAERVVDATNAKVAAMIELMADLRREGLLSEAPFDESIEFLAFDFWHYFGRTAKHGAFMGGADFVQWHGNYELLAKMVEMEELAAQLRSRR